MASPAVMRPSAVRSQARKVRSLANDEPHVGLVAVGGLFGRDHGRPSWRTARRVASTARGSVTPVTEIVVDGTGAAAVTGAVAVAGRRASNAASIWARSSTRRSRARSSPISAIGHARGRRPDDTRLDGRVVLDDQAQRGGRGGAAVGAGRARARRPASPSTSPSSRPTARTSITIRHLLTHTAGIRAGDAVTSTAPGTAYWDEVVAGICAIEREPDWIPGRGPAITSAAG